MPDFLAAPTPYGQLCFMGFDTHLISFYCSMAAKGCPISSSADDRLRSLCHQVGRPYDTRDLMAQLDCPRTQSGRIPRRCAFDPAPGSSASLSSQPGSHIPLFWPPRWLRSSLSAMLRQPELLGSRGLRSSAPLRIGRCGPRCCGGSSVPRSRPR